MRVSTEITIRRMVADDVPRVMVLEREIFPTPWPISVFERALARSNQTIYLVAESGNGLIGYMGADLQGREAHITNLAVKLEFRRQGVGSAMLAECISHSLKAGARWLSLEVREGSIEAREFYRALGFRELGMRTGYYDDTGENAVVMTTGNIRGRRFKNLLEGAGAKLSRGDGEC